MRGADPLESAGSLELPEWAVVSRKRREHIARVTALLEEWARRMALSPAEARQWRDAGRFHDALRDASEPHLREILPESALSAGLMHGPAAARLLREEGEQRSEVIEAVAYHTVGHAGWGLTGRALYCADYLEPGRSFDRETRAELRQRFPSDPAAVLKEVVRSRLHRAIANNHPLRHETVELWNSVLGERNGRSLPLFE